MNRIALAASPKYSWTASTRSFAPSLMLASSPANRCPRESDPVPGNEQWPGTPRAKDVPEAAWLQSSDAALPPVAYPPMQPLLARDRMSTLLDAARGRRIAVIGDAMLDVYLRGDVERISPEAPVPVVRVRDRRFALGGAGNVAQNVRAAGAGCDLVAAIGDDAGGRQLSAMLGAIGAGLDSLVTVDRPTT